LETRAANRPCLPPESQKSQSRVKSAFERPWDRLVRQKRPQTNHAHRSVKEILGFVR
jgi:hypothetical protein